MQRVAVASCLCLLIGCHGGQSKRGGFIFWQRERLEQNVVYSLRFQYKEALKDWMAPIVEHVNASWMP